MTLTDSENLQLATTWADKPGGTLRTALKRTPLAPPKGSDILVRMLGVGLHGSFWLATHPELLHPRWKEFMQNGGFVFGNGGVGRVVALGPDVAPDAVAAGDYIAVFGHVPCDEPGCLSCRQAHRYVECEYNKATIIGHGKGGVDGTLAQYVHLPRETWGLCYKASDSPTKQDLLPFLYAFLAADVRNSLTRHPEGLQRNRALLIGAGLSGSLAASMLLQENPNCKIVAVDVSRQRAEAVSAMDPERIRAVVAPDVETLSTQCKEWFDGHGPDLVMDCASEDATSLWATPQIVRPGTLCILFGFGLKRLVLEHSLLQLSGLNIQMCKGVGDRENRKLALELLKGPTGQTVMRAIEAAQRVPSLEALESLVYEYHHPPKPLHQSPVAWLDMFDQTAPSGASE